MIIVLFKKKMNLNYLKLNQLSYCLERISVCCIRHMRHVIESLSFLL